MLQANIKKQKTTTHKFNKQVIPTKKTKQDNTREDKTNQMKPKNNIKPKLKRKIKAKNQKTQNIADYNKKKENKKTMEYTNHEVKLKKNENEITN